MAYTLTLLGTDTVYTPFPLPGVYEKGESLSYVSSLIGGPPQDVNSTTQFRNDQIAVVNGPTTRGSEIGDRIARGVEAALEAISRGETHINIIAHSRGAVEAILVAHEVERIQTLLQKPTLTVAQLTESECGYTKAAMRGVHKEAFDRLNLEQIKKHIGGVKLSILNIDPVPGGNIYGISRLGRAAWRDPRFYRVPKIVQEYEQYTYENERTRCFKPIVPKCDSSKTKFSHQSLPGHHGTGSGNLLDQQGKPVPLDKSTEHVQQLVISKVVDFLARNKVEISARKEQDPFDQLMGKLLISPQLRAEAILDLYHTIMENKPAYQYFNQTTYHWIMGQEQALSRYFGEYKDERIVHYEAHTDTYLGSLIPPIPGGHFYNGEHARLYLNKQLGLHDDLPLHETINQASEKLLELSHHVQKFQELASTDGFIDLDASHIQNPLAKAVHISKGDFSFVVEGLGTLIEGVRQSYLQGKYIGSQEGKAVYHAVKNAFSSFKAFSSENPGNELAQTIWNSFSSNLKNTLETKAALLKSQHSALPNKLENNAYFSNLQIEIRLFNQQIHLLEIESGTEEEHEYFQLASKLDLFQREASEIASQNPNPDEIRTFLINHVEGLQGLSITVNDRDEVISLISEAIEDSLNNPLVDVINLYTSTQQFIDSLPNFIQLDDSLDNDQMLIDLQEQQAKTLQSAVNYIKKSRIPLEEIMALFGEKHAILYQQLKDGVLKPKPKLEELPDAYGKREEMKMKKPLAPEEEHKQQSQPQMLQTSLLANIANHLTPELDQLTGKKEEKLNKLIDSRLKPLTEKYLKSLAKEIKKKVDPELNEKDVLARTYKLQNYQSAHSKLIDKFNAVYDLHKTLHRDSKPSEKFNTFCTMLNEHNDKIQIHRDPAWLRYTANTLIVLGIIVTGVLPGLTIIGIAAAVGNSPKFWASSGQTFFQSSKEIGQKISQDNEFNAAPKIK